MAWQMPQSVIQSVSQSVRHHHFTCICSHCGAPPPGPKRAQEAQLCLRVRCRCRPRSSRRRTDTCSFRLPMSMAHAAWRRRRRRRRRVRPTFTQEQEVKMAHLLICLRFLRKRLEPSHHRESGLNANRMPIKVALS